MSTPWPGRFPSPRWSRALFAAPGNPGLGRLATLVPLKADDVEGLTAFAVREQIDLVVVGPEAPLVAGLVDRLLAAGVLAFGPTAGAARIEGSKAFAKEVMVAAGIPTAAYATFTEPGAARAWARQRDGQVVVKADGLAAGKGVVVCGSVEEAEAAIREILVERIHGAAGATLLLEEKLTGPEASCIAFTDGERVRMLPAAQDHKRIFDGDRGPNTGGMGPSAPPPRSRRRCWPTSSGPCCCQRCASWPGAVTRSAARSTPGSC